LIIGQETPDDGSVERPRKLTIGYFNQDISGLRGRTVLVETVAGAGEVADLGTEMKELEDQMASGCEDLDAVVGATEKYKRATWS
jgi:ATPase subunit of ABC transporter with duplicated ATPase domains